MKRSYYPERIVCLSPDLVNTLSAIGCAKNIVGKPVEVSGPETEHAKIIGGFGTPDLDKIMALKPDLVIGYCEICECVMAQLIRNNINVLALQYSTLGEIYQAIHLLGNICGRIEEAARLTDKMRREFQKISDRRAKPSPGPRVYFEEWNDPYVSGMEWISEIITVAGGMDVFAARCHPKKYLARAVTTEEVVAAAPDIMFASWCGKPVKPDAIKQRRGWDKVPAVAKNRIYEVPGNIILQPGTALVEGARYMSKIIDQIARDSQL